MANQQASADVLANKLGQLQASLERIGDACLALNSQLHCIFANEGAAVLLGKSKADLMGHSVDIATLPFFTPDVLALYREAYRTQQQQLLEVPAPQSAKWHVHRIYPDAQGLSVFIETLSGYEQTNKARNEASDNMQRLMDGLPLGMLLTDIDTRQFVYANQAICQMFGYSPTEFEKLSPTHLHPDYEAKRVKAVIDGMLEGKTTRLHNLDSVHKNGSIFTVEVDAVLVMYKGRQCISGLFKDVTEQKRLRLLEQQAKAQITASELLMRQAQEVGSMGSWELLHADYSMKWSDTTYRIFEVDPSVLTPTHQSFMQLVYEEDVPLLDAAFANHIEQRSDFNIVFRIITANNKLKYVHEKCKTEYDAHGKPLRTVGVVLDITKQKLTELSLKKERQKYQALIEHAPVGIVAIGEADDLFFTNQKFAQITGYKSTDFDSLNDWWQQAYPDESARATAQKKWKQIFTQSKAKKSSANPIESAIVCKDGSSKYVEVGYVYTGEYQLMTLVDITQRKVAEETLAANEAKFRQIAEQMSDMVWIGDLNYKASYVSPSVEKIYGVSVDEYFNFPLEKRFPQHSIDIFKKAHQNLIAELQANPATQSREVTFEIEAFKRDGTPIWIRSSTKVLCDEHNTPIGIIGVSSDITDRKKAEIALTQSEARYRTLFEGSPVGVAVTNSQNEIVLGNSSFTTLTGYDYDDVKTPETWWQQAYPDARYRSVISKEWLKSIEIANTTNCPITAFEALITCKDGKARYFQLGYMPGDDFNIITFTDVHDLRVAQQAVASASENLQNLMSSMPQGVGILDMRTQKYLYVNASLCKMLGYTATEFTQLTPLNLHPDYERDRVVEVIERLEDGREEAPLLFDTITKAGKILQVEISPLFVEYNGEKAIAGVFTDVTEKIQASRALQLAKDKAEENELLLKQAQHIALMGSWTLDYVQDQLQWSDSVFEILGLIPDSVTPTYKLYQTFVHPDDKQILDDAFQNHVHNHQPYEIRHRIILHNGTVKHINASAITNYDLETGKPLYTIGVMTDVTKQVLTEQALFAAKEKAESRELILKQVQKIGLTGYWEHNHITNYITWSEDVFEIFELDATKEAPDYEAFFKALPKEDAIRVQKEYQQHLKDKSQFDTIHRIITSNGKIKYVHQRCQTFYDEQGNAIKSIGAVADITQVQKATAEIQIQKDYIESLLAAIPDLLFVLDANGCYTAFKSANEDDLMMPPDAFIGKHYKDILPPSLVVAFEAALETTRNNGATKSWQYEIILGGEKKYFDAKLQLMDNGSILILSRDVTASKKASLLIEESENKYRLVFEATPVGLVALDEAENILVSNKQFGLLTGYSDEDMPNINVWWQTAFPEENYRKEIFAIWKNAAAEAKRIGGNLPSIEVTIQCKHTGKRIFEVGIVYSAGIHLVSFRDIHEKRLAQRDLIESENRFRQIAETVEEVFWLYSADLKELLYINPAYEKVFGSSIEELYKEEKFFLKAIHPDDAPSVIAGYHEYLRTYQFDMEYRIVLPAGEVRWIRNKSLPVRNEEGTIVAHAGTAEDITQKKLALTKLKEQEAFQHLLMMLATEFINSPTHQFDALMNSMLEKVGIATKTDRVYIFEHDNAHATTSNTYEWCATGVSAEIQNLQQQPLSLYSSVLKAHKAGEVYHLPDIETIRSNEDFYEHLNLQEIKSAVVLPLIHDNEIIGTIGFDAVKEARTFKETEIQLLQVLAEIVTNGMLRKKADLTIRKSEAEYRTLFNNMAQGVVYQDVNGQIVKGNKAAEEVLGLSLDQMIGRTSLDPRWHTIHEDGSPYPGELHPAMITLTTGLPVHNKEMGVYHPPTNSYKWIIISTEPEFTGNEQLPSRVFSTFTDITDRKAAENKIQLQANLLRLLMDIATTYINVPVDQADPAIHNSLSVIGNYTNADRAYIFEYDFENNSCSNTYEWCAPDIAPQLAKRQQLPLDQFAQWIERHRKGQPVIITSLHDFPANEQPQQRELMARFDVMSLLTIPMIEDGKLLGFVGFDAVTTTRTFEEEYHQLLGIYAQLLINVKNKVSTENKLADNKRFLENIIENSGSLIYVKDTNSTYRIINAKWEAITGYSRTESVGKTDIELFGAEQGAYFMEADKEAMAAGGIVEKEETFLSPSGLKHFISIKFPLRNNEGAITGTCGMSTEITERKQAEILLRENETRLVELTSQSRTIAWETDIDGMYTYVSDVVKMVLGYTPDEMIGKMHYCDLHPEKNRAHFIETTQKILHSNAAFHEYEHEALHKNGQLVWLATSGMPITNEAGELIGFRGGDTDITNRKTMELAVVKSEASYRLLAENSTDVIWIYDIGKHALKYASPSCIELHGFTVAESLRLPIEETMTPSSFSLVMQKIKENIELYQSTGIIPPSQMLEIEQYHKNGSIVWVEIVAKLQLNADNELEVLGVSRNITERKKAEFEKQVSQEALKESESRLEAIIETTSDNIWSINTQYEILYINAVFRDAFEASFGVRLQKGDNILDKLPPPFNASWKAHYDFVLQNISRNKFEEQYNFSTGQMWVEVAMFPIVANGETIGVSCFGKDITTQKISELALAESEQRFRSMFHDNASVMLLIDADNYNIIDSNPAAQKFYGWTTDDFKQLKITDVCLHPEKEKNQIGTASSNKNVRYEIMHRLSNGTVCEMEVFSSLLSINGKLILHEIIHDISAKKRAEAALIEKNKQLNLLIQSIPGVVFSCYNNNDNRMNFINDYVQEITGYSAAEINNNNTIHYRNLIHPEDIPKFDIAVEEAYTHKSRYNFSYRLLNKDGSYRWVYEIGEFQSYDGPSRDKRVDGIIFDITNRIANEEMKLNAAYDAAEAERTRISHEIHDGIQQTLVASKLMISSIRKDIDQMGGRLLEKYNNGIELLNQGITEARSIAHSLMPKQVNDYGYVVAVAHLIANLDKKIDIEFIHPDLMLNDGKFGTNLFRITQEAINNIIKHAAATKIIITLTEAGNRIILTIQDNGVGFDKRRINSPESGIGLQIMASRAAVLNAHFEVATAPGIGTTIIVDVPYE